jgi:ABC-2 type transport system ATP-binding protein
VTTDHSQPAGIEARDVCKSFGDHLVLDNVNLTVEEGTILSLLGPNGAGKTTMVRILSTLVPADSGSMRIAGHDVVTDPDGVRAVIGVTGQFSAVDNLLTGAENLQLMADLRHLERGAGRRRVAELLEHFDLTEAADKPLSVYSGGMRRRLDLAMTLVTRPRVIFLDEPTTGLDPRSRRTMWDIIRELASAGITILLTTQYLDEADQLADRIAVLDQGRIVAEGTPGELKSRMPGGHLRLYFADLQLLRLAANLLPEAAADPDQLVLQVPADGSADSVRDLLDQLHDAAIGVERLSIHNPDLDDVFLAVTRAHLTGTPVTGTPVTGTPVTGTPVTGTPANGAHLTAAHVSGAGADVNGPLDERSTPTGALQR